MSGHTTDNGLPAAYAYGRLLGAWQVAAARMFEAIAAGMRDATTRRPVSPEQREALRELAYRRRIERERTLALSYVDQRAARLRRDLGLPSVTPPEGSAS